MTKNNFIAIFFILKYIFTFFVFFFKFDKYWLNSFFINMTQTKYHRIVIKFLTMLCPKLKKKFVFLIMKF